MKHHQQKGLGQDPGIGLLEHLPENLPAFFPLVDFLRNRSMNPPFFVAQPSFSMVEAIIFSIENPQFSMFKPRFPMGIFP